MSFEGMPKKEKTVGEAFAEIEAVRAQIAAMGANDSEFAALNEIQANLESGTMSPLDAIAAATAVRDFKQDYH